MLKMTMRLRVKWAMVVDAVSRTLTYRSTLGALDPGTHRSYVTTPCTTPTYVLQYIL